MMTMTRHPALDRQRHRRFAVRWGFTMVEILATIALAAAILPPVMEGINLNLKTSLYARQQAQAVSLASSKLSEIVAAGQSLQQTATSGDFSPDWPDYHWTMSLSDWDSSTLRQVDVTVSWRQTGGDRSVTLTSLVYTGATQ